MISLQKSRYMCFAATRLDEGKDKSKDQPTPTEGCSHADNTLGLVRQSRKICQDRVLEVVSKSFKSARPALIDIETHDITLKPSSAIVAAG